MCVCARRVLDHPRRWQHNDGHPVLTAELYEADGAELAQLVTDLVALGLTCRVDGRSPWNPGKTLLLVIERARGDRVVDAMSRSHDGDRTATAEAGDWLVDYLTTRGGEASSAEVKQAGGMAASSSA